jgi:hypothetical protein
MMAKAELQIVCSLQLRSAQLHELQETLNGKIT